MTHRGPEQSPAEDLASPMRACFGPYQSRRDHDVPIRYQGQHCQAASAARQSDPAIDPQIVSEHQRQRHGKTGRTEQCNLIEQAAFQAKTESFPHPRHDPRPSPASFVKTIPRLWVQTYDGSIKKRLIGRLAGVSIRRIVKVWLKMNDPNATNCLGTSIHSLE
jgi:hypothetical protein